jgi:predicted membrane channel-forming protein YqfA (hemolysin III family)
MPAPYVLPTATDTSDVFNLSKYLTNLTNFMPIMLGVIWLIALIGAIVDGKPMSRAFIFSGFVASILSIILALTGLLNRQFMYFSFILVAVGIVWYKLENAPGI